MSAPGGAVRNHLPIVHETNLVSGQKNPARAKDQGEKVGNVSQLNSRATGEGTKG